MNLCDECDGRCCRENWGVSILPSDDINPDLLTPGTYGLEMAKKPGTTECIALVDGRCSIYKGRPLVCRQFKAGKDRCNALRNSKGIL